VVVDEAHKMSASFFSGEVKETKRYKLAKLDEHMRKYFNLEGSSWGCIPG
jgi:hypothetical protein